MVDDIVGMDSPCRAEPAEKRAMCRAMMYWDALRHDKGPPRADRLALDFDAELAPHLYVIALSDRPEDSIFAHCGGVLSRLASFPLVGRSVCTSLPGGMGEQMVEFLRGTVQYRQPLADTGSQLVGDGVELLYRNILMPLVGATDRVEQVLGAFSYRIVV